MSTDTSLTDSFPSQPGALIRVEWRQARPRINVLTFSFIAKKNKKTHQRRSLPGWNEVGDELKQSATTGVKSSLVPCEVL